MADKDAAKRRRQARNRQERMKRQSRVQGARRSESARPARTTEGAPTADAAAAGSPPASGGLLGKLFPPRPAPAKGPGGRPARTAPAPSVAVDVGEVSGVRGAFVRATAQPGGRATVLALMVAIVSGVTLLAFPIAPDPVLEGLGRVVVEASTDDADQRAELVEEFADADAVLESVLLTDLVNPAVAAVYALIPVAIAAVAVAALHKPTRSRTLLISAMAAAMYVFLTGPIGIYFLVGALALGWGAFQSRKADTAAALAAASDDG